MTLRQRISRARKAYLAKRSNARLRTYLTLKARAGQFDSRMCAYYGVSANVNSACKRAICRAYAAGLVPTSTTGGQHAPGSYHYQRRAVDFGVRREEVGTAKQTRKLKAFQHAELKRRNAGKIRPVELIGPDNSACILKGSRTTLGEGTSLEQAHDNHVHEAF